MLNFNILEIMKKNGIYFLSIVLALFSIQTVVFAEKKEKKDSITYVVKTNIDGQGTDLFIEFHKGKEHNHPTMAVWIETMDEEFVETLYITKSVATGFFGHGEKSEGIWSKEPGPAYRPATLPYWFHKRTREKKNDIPTPENPVPDAITGATPPGSFIIDSRSEKILEGKFRIVAEINQTWDWNEYWNNTKYPDDMEYKTSCQPALIYAVTVDPGKPDKKFYLNPIGHSHYSGKNGELYTDLSTFTTALDIFEKIIVKLDR